MEVHATELESLNISRVESDWFNSRRILLPAAALNSRTPQCVTRTDPSERILQITCEEENFRRERQKHWNV